MSRLLAVLAVVATAAPAMACINDSELKSHEREFRSQYGKPSPAPSVPAPVVESPRSPLPGLIAGGTGVLLLAGATVVAWRGAVSRG